MDTRPSRGGSSLNAGPWDGERDYAGCGYNMDFHTDPAVDISMKSLFIWPAVALVLGIWWAWGTKAPEAETSTPPVPAVTLNAPVNPLPVVQPAPPDPRAQPAGAGHWIWIPDRGPGGESYSIPVHH